MTFEKHRQRGFSLVELMVALVLGLIVVAGLIQVLISNRTAYHLQESNNFLQQNLRFATDRMDWSLRMADFWGGAAASTDPAAGITGMGDATGASGCDDTFMKGGMASTVGGGGVFGYDGKATFPISNCLANAANYMPGSDVLVVRYADTDACNLTDPTGKSGAYTIANCMPASRFYLTTAIGFSSQLFAATGAGAGVVIPNASTQVYVYPLRAEVYYLQPCSNPGTGGCTASSDDGTPVPTLMRLRIDSAQTKMVAEPIVEGIEQLQFEYGVTADQKVTPGASTTTVTQWLPATGMTVAQWQRVIAVRINMVARGRQRDTSVPSNYTMNLTAGCKYGIAVGGAVSLTSTTDCAGFTLANVFRPDQFSRKLIQQTVQLRNRVRGLQKVSGS